jgi:hypothetical protein
MERPGREQKIRGSAIWLVGAGLLGVGSGASAQSQDKDPQGFAISATERVRAEAIGGQARAGFNSADELLNFRTTVLASYRANEVRIVGELWDSRVYGGERGTPVSTGEVNTLELVQAYVAARLSDGGRGPIVDAQAGRFTLNLGSRRLVAADDYRNTTNGYTGARLDLTWRSGWKASAIYTLPQQRRPDALDALLHNEVRGDREGRDLVLWGAIGSRSKVLGEALLEASFFHLGERDRPGRPTRDRSLDTASVRLLREPTRSHFDLEVEGIVQRGQISTGLATNAPRQQVAAWFVHADAGYTFASRWQPRLSIEYDHASGDGSSGRYGRFDTLFGMRRADLAPAGLYNAIARTNIASPGVRAEAVPSRQTDWFVSYRPMWLAARRDTFASTGVRDVSGLSGRFAGHQIDSRIRYRASRRLTLEADAVLLAKGRFLRHAPNSPRGKLTRYLSLNALATF